MIDRGGGVTRSYAVRCDEIKDKKRKETRREGFDDVGAEMPKDSAATLAT
jgi:hypothetical protein